MAELTDRRIKLLKAIVEEFVETAEPVGSKTLVKRYKLRVSPATVRNEMAVLVEEGYLDQPHTSAGRIPAPMGLRYYIRSLMDEDDIPVLEEVAIKQRLEEHVDNKTLLLRNSAKALADRTNLASVVTLDDGSLFNSGLVHLLDNPEFYDIDVTRAVLTALDNHTLLSEVFSRGVSDEAVNVLIGEEIEMANFSEIGVVFTGFSAGDQSGYVGVVGPYRMDYSTIIPTVRYFGDLLDEIA